MVVSFFVLFCFFFFPPLLAPPTSRATSNNSPGISSWSLLVSRNWFAFGSPTNKAGTWEQTNQCWRYSWTAWRIKYCVFGAMWLCHQSITHKTKIWNYFLPQKKNDDGTPSYAKIHVIISICDDVKTFKYMCHNEVLFLFLWKFIQMWKNKYVKRIFYHFFLF